MFSTSSSRTTSLALFMFASLSIPMCRPTCAAPSSVAVPAAGNYDPAQTQVAILPVMNQTKGVWDDLKARENEKGKQELVLRFREHGFPLIEDALIAKSLSDLGVNPQDMAHQAPDILTKPETLSKIGQAVNARLIVLLVITDTRSGSHFNLLGGFHKEGGATVKLWLVDAPEDRALLSGVTKSSKSSGSGGLVEMAGTGGSGLSIRAIGGATTTALNQFIKPYPLVKAKDDKGH